jgi:hypothetical protein
MKMKLLAGIFLLFTGVFTVIGIGLILLHMLDEYKRIAACNADGSGNHRYISEDVIEEFK